MNRAICRAVYAGSFDPPTWGHEWIFANAAALFDKLVILVADNPNKNNLLSPQVRVDLIKKITEGIDNIFIDYLSGGLLVDYCLDNDLPYIVRGLRDPGDFAYELEQQRINEGLGQYYNNFVYLVSPAHLSHISSSLVRALLEIKGGKSRLDRYVSPDVRRYLENPGLFESGAFNG